MPRRPVGARSRRSSGVILTRLQTLLGEGTVQRIEVRNRVTDHASSVIVSAVRTPTGKLLGVLKDLTAPATRRPRRSPKPSGAPASTRRSSTSASWATSSRPAGTEPGAAGGAQGRAARSRRGGHDQQGLRLGTEGGHAGRPGHPRRRHRHRGRGRNGVDEQHARICSERPRGTAYRQQRAGRLDDHRRPVVRVRAVPHGQFRRSRRRALSRRPRARRTNTPPAAIRRRPRRPTPAGSRTRSCRSRFRSKKAIRWSSIATNRSAPTPRSRRSATEARVQGRRHGDGRQRARRQRRRVRARRDGEERAKTLGARAARAHRRPGDQRPRAEVRADDAGRSGPPRRGKGRLGSRGRRSVRDQRSVFGAGRRGA